MSTSATTATINSERAVQLLLRQHELSLLAIKERLADVATGPGADYYDDIALLRFLMSSDGDVPKAESAVRSTMKYRKDKAELLQAAAENRYPAPYFAVFIKYMTAAIHATTIEGDIIYIIRAGLGNTRALLKELSQDQVMDCMLPLNPALHLGNAMQFYRREQIHILCDQATRKTGRLCKAITVNDLNFATMSKMDRQFSHCLSTVSTLSEIYYPQFLDTAVMINLPTVMKAVMRTMGGFMPKKTQEKLRVCPGRTLTKDISTCPFVRARLSVDSIPTFLGGRCECAALGGCVPGTANDQKESNLEVDSDGMSKCTVAAGRSYETFVPVEAGASVSYAFMVEKGTISSGAVTLEVVLRGTRMHDGRELMLLQAEKYKPEQGLIKGELVCPEAGTCVFTFSNDSSMWSRNIRFTAVAVQTGAGPDGSDEERKKCQVADG